MRHAPKLGLGWAVAVLMAVLASALAASAEAPKAFTDVWRVQASLLPRARPTVEEMNEPCRATEFVSDAALASVQEMKGVLLTWASRSFSRGGRFNYRHDCRDGPDPTMNQWDESNPPIDWAFIVRQWQRAYVRPESGRITDEDARHFEDDLYPRYSGVVRQARVAVDGPVNSFPDVFGFIFNRAVPPWPRCDAAVRVDTHCVDWTKPAVLPGTPVRVPSASRPPWMSPTVRVTVERGEIAGIRFTVTDARTALVALDQRFGERHTAETWNEGNSGTMCQTDQAGHVVGACVDVSFSGWASYRYKWYRDDLIVRMEGNQVSVKRESQDKGRFP